MNVESNIKVTLTTEEKNTLADARTIIDDLFRTMQDYSCCSSDFYTISAENSRFEGDEVPMSELEGIAEILASIYMSDNLKLEV